MMNFQPYQYPNFIPNNQNNINNYEDDEGGEINDDESIFNDVCNQLEDLFYINNLIQNPLLLMNINPNFEIPLNVIYQLYLNYDQSLINDALEQCSCIQVIPEKFCIQLITQQQTILLIKNINRNHSKQLIQEITKILNHDDFDAEFDDMMNCRVIFVYQNEAQEVYEKIQNINFQNEKLDVELEEQDYKELIVSKINEFQQSQMLNYNQMFMQMMMPNMMNQFGGYQYQMNQGMMQQGPPENLFIRKAANYEDYSQLTKKTTPGFKSPRSQNRLRKNFRKEQFVQEYIKIGTVDERTKQQEKEDAEKLKQEQEQRELEKKQKEEEEAKEKQRLKEEEEAKEKAKLKEEEEKKEQENSNGLIKIKYEKMQILKIFQQLQQNSKIQMADNLTNLEESQLPFLIKSKQQTLEMLEPTQINYPKKSFFETNLQQTYDRPKHKFSLQVEKSGDTEECSWRNQAKIMEESKKDEKKNKDSFKQKHSDKYQEKYQEPIKKKQAEQYVQKQTKEKKRQVQYVEKGDNQKISPSNTHKKSIDHNKSHTKQNPVQYVKKQ